MQQSKPDYRAIFLAGVARENRLKQEARKAWAITIVCGIALGIAGAYVQSFF